MIKEMLFKNEKNGLETKKELSRDYIIFFNREYDFTTDKTQKTYKGAINQFYNYLEAKGITAPKEMDIINYRNFLQEEGKKTTTINLYLKAVKTFFHFLEKKGLYSDVAKDVKILRLSKEHTKDGLTSSQVESILRSIDTSTEKGLRDKAIIYTAVTLALRCIEISRVNIEDIKTRGDNLVLYTQGKDRTDKNDFIIIPKETERVIREYLKVRSDSKDGKAPLFKSLDHKEKGEGRITPESISRLIKNYYKENGLNSDRLTAHSLRHTAITLSLLNGENLQDTMHYARHLKMDTTLIYLDEIGLDSLTNSETVANLIKVN